MNIISEDNNRKEVLKLLAWFELCSTMYINKDINVNINGNTCNLKIKFDTLNEQTEFNEIKQDLLKQYNIHKKEIKNINLK